MKNFVNSSFLFDLSQVDWDLLVESSNDVNEAVEKWSALLSLIIEKHAPMRTIKVSDKLTPWLTTHFRKLARSRDKLKTSAIENTSSIRQKAQARLLYQKDCSLQGKFERGMENDQPFVE